MQCKSARSKCLHPIRSFCVSCRMLALSQIVSRDLAVVRYGYSSQYTSTQHLSSQLHLLTRNTNYYMAQYTQHHIISCHTSNNVILVVTYFYIRNRNLYPDTAIYDISHRQIYLIKHAHCIHYLSRPHLAYLINPSSTTTCIGTLVSCTEGTVGILLLFVHRYNSALDLEQEF